VKRKNANYHSLCSIQEGIDRSEFIEKTAKEITRTLHDPVYHFSIGAKNLWAEMNKTERLGFVNACLECFYWIYIMRTSRENPTAYSSWEDATIDQKVGTVAVFCSFILGMEFEHRNYQEPDDLESFSSEWVN
jgi:hypothetical protein